MSETEKKQSAGLDDNGRVSELDEERLARKVRDVRRFENASDASVLGNKMRDRFSLREWNWNLLGHTAYRAVVTGSKTLKYKGPVRKAYTRLLKWEPAEKSNSSGIVIPLDVDLDDEARQTVVPMDLIKEALAKTDFIGGMNKCVCRDTKKCSHYPHDLACLFFGESGRTIVRHGLGRQLTYEEACERVDRAARLGLVAQTLFVEIEQLLWGFPSDKLDSFLEICFCCPCCCVAMQVAKNAPRELRSRVHPTGWTATVDRDLCVDCGECLSAPCPEKAVRRGENGKIQIDQEVCLGCGICKRTCPSGAIAVRQTMPMRRDVHEYFLKEFNIDLKYKAEDGLTG